MAHGLRLFARAHVGEHVGATKRVDRLLGIADEEDRRVRVAVDAPDDLVLERVRVLEFVDQRRAVPSAEGVGERPAVTRLGERALERRYQVVVVLDAPVALSAAELRRREPDRARAQRLHPCVVRGRERRRARPETFARVEDGVRWRHVLHLGPVDDAARREAAEPLRQRRTRRLRHEPGEVPAALGDAVDTIRRPLERRARQRFDRRAVTCPRVAQLGTARLECTFERRNVHGVVRRVDAPIRPAGVVLHQSGQHLGREPRLLEHVAHERRSCAVELAPPEIVDDLLRELALVRDELQVEGDAALEGALGEHALAEAVDREDRGLVEAGERPIDDRERGRTIGEPREERPQELVGRLPRPERVAQRGERLPNAIAELRRRRLRVGDDEDLAHAEPALEHEAEIELGDRERLPGARAGLDRDATGERDRQRIEHRAEEARLHGHRTAASRIGPKTRPATASSRSSIGSIPRNASRM